MKIDMEKTKWTPEKIRSLRREYGENQGEFALRFRLSIQAIQGWEQGKDKPSGPATVLLDQLAKALETKPIPPACESQLQTA